jgi:8-oxo-dGTP diphosphatase
MDTRIQTAGTLAFSEANVLLVKHGESAQHLTGVWGLPGGRLDEGESLIDAAAREFQEETGLTPDKTSMMQLSTVYQGDIVRKSGEILLTYWNVFLVKNFTGDLVGTDETIPEWVKISEVGKLNLLPNTENAIQEGLQLLSK